MKFHLYIWMLLFAYTSAYACPVGKSGPSKADQARTRKKIAQKYTGVAKRKVASQVNIPTLPTADSSMPWGGKEPVKWKSEAILANAVSRALNLGWKQKDVQDVLVSVPVTLVPTSERPYGDGQTNATLGFGPNWTAREPQLVATLVILKSGRRVVDIWFSPAIEFKTLKATVMSYANDRKEDEVNLTKEINGYHATWEVPASLIFGGLEQARVAWVRPSGWSSAFPIDFRIPIYSSSDLVSAAIGAQTTGKSPLDPMSIRSLAQASGKMPQDVLLETSFGAEWVKNENGGDYFIVDNIHGEAPSSTGKIKTAVGGGLTWVILRGANSTFKNLYTCFDKRNFAQETAEGVPSGGGWHEIGDPAETIINNLEEGPVVVGHATGVPFQPPPDGLNFAWELKDVVTIRFLMPGEAMMTGVGDVTWKEDEDARPNEDWGKSKRAQDKSGKGRNYHWFFFHADQPTCTQEWVHICRPNTKNRFGLESKVGLNCSPQR